MAKRRKRDTGDGGHVDLPPFPFDLFICLRSIVAIAAITLASFGSAVEAERPRLIVLTDIGGDPDDQQSMIRLMVYANEFEIEGLIATASGTPGELSVATTRPDLIREIVAAYGKVRPNLDRHADGWPESATLLDRIKTGNPNRGRRFIGDGRDTEGSRWLIERVDAGMPERPLNIVIWGGQTDFAQALWRVKHDRGAEGLAKFMARFRVYDINDQDRIADWIRTEFPGMFYILAKAPAGEDKRKGIYRGMYLGGDESLTSRQWIERHIVSASPLGGVLPIEDMDRSQSARLHERGRLAIMVLLSSGRREHSR